MEYTELMEKLLEDGESSECEFKKSENSLPDDLWETYSAFANTNGGIIFLGIKEKKEKFTILGVKNAKSIEKQFFDCINNKNKVNTNIINNDNVKIISIDNNDIIKIVVPRALRSEKPIYINNNPMTGTYKEIIREIINVQKVRLKECLQNNQILQEII